MTGRPRKVWLGAAGIIAGLGVLGIAGLWAGQDSLLYAPDRASPGTPASGVDDVTFRTSDGLDLRAWLVTPRSSAHRTVLYLPGNGGNRAGRAPLGEILADAGFTTLLVDYRGFGGNPGSPSEAGLLEDARSAYRYLRSEGYAADDIFLIGESLGTAVAVSLASEVDVGGVLLRSPFTSMADVARHLFKVPAHWLLRDHYDSRSRIPGVTAPVVILAGARDTLVPAAQSEELARAVPHLVAYVELPEAGHNDEVWFSDFIAGQLAQLTGT